MKIPDKTLILGCLLALSGPAWAVGAVAIGAQAGAHLNVGGAFKRATPVSA